MNVNLLAATQTVEKTMPFVFYRWLVFLGLALGFLLSALAGAGTAIAMSSFSSDPTMFANFGAILGFGAFGWLLYRFRTSVATAVATPHLLLLARVIQGDAIPAGKAQLQFAKQAHAERLPPEIDPRLLATKARATLGALPLLQGLTLIPCPVDKLMPVVERLSAWVSASNADAVLAHAATDPQHSPWNAARLAILRQARNLKTYLRQRGYVTLFVLAGWIAAYTVLLVPSLKLAAALPFATSFWPYVVAGVLSWNLKASFLDPIAQAAMIRLDLAMDAAEPPPEVSARLTAALADFRDICARAAESP
ncbi:MAG: hypothetical protein FJ189_09695 [Gammaproteobacteria bacterium]|nr:hypothetical protein [Gammaproteobacteria bacterium]